MRRIAMAFLVVMALFATACGGNPCEQLIKYYCEQKQDKNLCETFTDRVNAGMSKETCEANLKQAK